DNINEDHESVNDPIFGESLFTNDLIIKYINTLNTMLETHKDNFDMEDVHLKISEQIPLGYNFKPPNVVILKPGDAPNCDENVHNACDQYYHDLLNEDDHLYVACDQAIFGRLISYKERHPCVHLLLGQWHTSKSMWNTLITIFSGYGLFNLAAKLGVKYLNKFESVVDYRATFHVLELIWVAVGVALCQYVKLQGITMLDILEGNNHLVKVWYLFFCWTGYFVGHKIGIRRGNYKMQMANLAAFSPLFAVAGKSNYAKSVVHFLVEVHENPTLQKLLQIVCSVNLTREGHYLGFDEALEEFGVKFTKQNISG